MTNSDPHSTRLEALLRTVAAGSRRVAWAESFGRLALALGLAAVLVVLLARSVAGWDPLAMGTESPLAGASILAVILLAAAAAIAGWRSRARAFDAASSALWLDLRSGSGGEVVTAAQLDGAAGGTTGSQAWRARAEGLASQVEELPRPDWRRAAARAGLGAAAVLLGVFLPVREASASGPNSLPEIFEERIGELEEKLAALHEEAGLEESERAEVEEALERLEASLDDEPDLEATYEALDTLEEQLGERAEEALAAASEALAQIAEESRMAGADDDSPGAALDSGAPNGSPESNALEELIAGLDLPTAGLELEGASLEGANLGELASLAAADLSKLSPEELEALKEALQAAMSEPLESLASAGLLKDAGQLSGGGDFKSLSELGTLSEADLAMLEAGEPCPDCGKTPAENPGGT